MKQITAVVVGYGNRGSIYCSYSKKAPEDFKVIGAVDSNPVRLKLAEDKYNIPRENCFETVKDFLKREKFADVALVCTQDQDHFGHVMPMMKLGYDILLEKPISDKVIECIKIAEYAKESNRKVVVGHVLRYTVFYQQIKKLLQESAIGKILCINQIENVGYWHYAHSYVRGNWSNSDKSSPMLLAKCCHDLDVFNWLTNKKCTKVSSFGELSYFVGKNAPIGSTTRCVDDCAVKDTCPYNAVKFYYEDRFLKGDIGWPVDVICDIPTSVNVMNALNKTNYGRCVFRCNNNVVDHQVVNMVYEDNIIVSLTMCGLTEGNFREIKIMGTTGEITGNLEGSIIHVKPFGREPYDIDVSKLTDDFSFHSGGDNRLMADLICTLRNQEGSEALTTVEQSIESHLMADAAEKSRLSGGKCIDLANFVTKLLNKVDVK